MPHVILEHSANLLEKSELSGFFSKLHQCLVTELTTQLETCKSRAYESHTTHLGDGTAEAAMVHLQVQVLAGRRPEVLAQTNQAIYDLMTDFFQASRQQLDLKLSVELTELSPHYLN